MAKVSIATSVLFLSICLMSSILTVVNGMRSFQSRFNMGGIKTLVVFEQENSSSPVKITIQNRTASTFHWAIHEYPFVYDRNGSMSCAESGQIVNGGNLSMTIGMFSSRTMYSTAALNLYRNETIFGRSVVIYSDNFMSMKACANIIEKSNPIAYSAVTVQGTVSGRVEFFQLLDTPSGETLVVGELFYVNGTTSPSSGHRWFVGTGSVMNGCISAGPMLATSSSGSCSMYHHGGCSQGDLTGKLGTISVGVIDSSQSKRRRFRFIDLNLNVNMLSLINGKTVVIESPSRVNIACGHVHKKGPMDYTADFSNTVEGVTGTITFSQNSPYHPTKVAIDINGLRMSASGYHVHEFPIPKPAPQSNMCGGSTVGAHLNPFKISNKPPSYPAPTVGTSDQYEVGDLSAKFGTLDGKASFQTTYYAAQIPLYGRYNILGRALVVHRNDTKGSRWFCTNIAPPNAVYVAGRTDFAPTSNFNGYVVMQQYIQRNGIHSDTGLTVSLSAKSGPKTADHNWHVHIDRVGRDYNSTTSLCQSVLGHFNPHKVNDKGSYTSECSPVFPNRCEVGDLSNKQAPYSIGSGKMYYVDVDTPLFGRFTVLGRSFTFHVANRGAGRLACADILPKVGPHVDLLKFSYKLANKTAFNRANFAKEVAAAMNLETWQIVYVSRTDISDEECNSRVSFYVIGKSSSETVAVLKEKAMERAKKLKNYDSQCSLASDLRSSLLYLLLPLALVAGSHL